MASNNPQLFVAKTFDTVTSSYVMSRMLSACRRHHSGGARRMIYSKTE